ncbi:hypothetical protein SUGI_0292700 [Cryptomeria japonica]|nr:hypothetical protein SUGI_0292700 [Cryptomeria japonica]
MEHRENAVAKVPKIFSFFVGNLCDLNGCGCGKISLFPLFRRAWKRCSWWRYEYSDVHRGYVPVRVGVEQTDKFMIPVFYLNHPLFANLLADAEEVFGFEQRGSLRIPCTLQNFVLTMRAIMGSCR